MLAALELPVMLVVVLVSDMVDVMEGEEMRELGEDDVAECGGAVKMARSANGEKMSQIMRSLSDLKRLSRWWSPDPLLTVRHCNSVGFKVKIGEDMDAQ